MLAAVARKVLWELNIIRQYIIILWHFLSAKLDPPPLKDCRAHQEGKGVRGMKIAKRLSGCCVFE